MEGVIEHFNLLGHPDQKIRQQANLYLMGLIDRQDVWIIAEKMITDANNANFQFLGAQILYQKVERDLSQLSIDTLNSLKLFVFGQLDNAGYNVATISKLGSTGALIACIMFLKDWVTLVEDLIAFMKKSQINLRNGLIVLERLPEQLRATNRIKHGVKLQIQNGLLVKHQIIIDIFESILNVGDQNLTGICLQTIQNWIRIGLPLMKWGRMIQIIITVGSLYQGKYYDNSIKVLVESLKATAQNKFQTLAQIDLMKERASFTEDEIQSLGFILAYVERTRILFLSAVEQLKDYQNLQNYCSLVKELLLSYRFLILEQKIGFQLIQILISVLDGRDYKLSYFTFDFWIDFSQKTGRSDISNIVDQKLWNIFMRIFDILLRKNLLENQNILQQIAKQDETLDDCTAITFDEYRKQSQHLLRFIYEFMVKKKKQQGSKQFFSKLIYLIEIDCQNAHPGRGIELSIYAIKSCLEAMVNPYDSLNISTFIDYLTQQIQKYNGNVPQRIAAEMMNLLKDCGREIKSNEALFLRCLAFCLRYVDDQQLCHYSVYAFQSLMEAVTEINSKLIDDLLIFYNSKQFTKQVILEKVLDGILSNIVKLKNREEVAHYFNAILTQMQNKYLTIISSSIESPNLFICLIQIKTMLESYSHFEAQDKDYFRLPFVGMANQASSIIFKLISSNIEKRSQFSNINELGMSVVVCRNALKIYENVDVKLIDVRGYITVMDLILTILNRNRIDLFLDYIELLEIIAKVLSCFMGVKVEILDQWLLLNLKHINTFFLGYINHISNQRGFAKGMNPDIIKWYYLIQQGVLIYSKQVFLGQQERQEIVNTAVLSLKYLNEKGMQRKILSFINLCIQIKEIYGPAYQQFFKIIFASIPIIHSICYNTLAKILVSLLEGIDVRGKEKICRSLLEQPPYVQVDINLKEILGKFLAFTIDTKVERYIKGILIDLTEITWKKTSVDFPMQLELRFTTWKREYNKSLKSGMI